MNLAAIPHRGGGVLLNWHTQVGKKGRFCLGGYAIAYPGLQISPFLQRWVCYTPPTYKQKTITKGCDGDIERFIREIERGQSRPLSGDSSLRSE